MKSKPSHKIDLNLPESPLHASAFGALEALDLRQLPPGKELPIPLVTQPSASAQQFILRREKKNRGGKTVVVVSGWKGSTVSLEDFARGLRKKLGCGGTVELGEIILQGDQPSEVASKLQEMGHQVRGVTS